MEPAYETLDQRTITEADARRIATLLLTIWPKPGRTVEGRAQTILQQWKDYRGPEVQHPRSFLVREGDRIIAHAQADPRTIRTTAGDLTVLALCRVCTLPEIRGRKLGRALAEAAFALVDQGVYPFSLFQTTEQVRPFYEKLGGTVVLNRCVNSLGENPEANPFWDPILMRYPANANWPTGTIDILGPGW